MTAHYDRSIGITILLHINCNLLPFISLWWWSASKLAEGSASKLVRVRFCTMVSRQNSKAKSKSKEENSSPCAACKKQRKKCRASCPLAPHFPQSNATEFSMVHKVFGTKNITKLLKKVAPKDKEEAVKNMVFEAKQRAKNPVGGCVSIIEELKHKVANLESQLTSAESRIGDLHHQNNELLTTVTALSLHSQAETVESLTKDPWELIEFNNNGMLGSPDEYHEVNVDDRLWDI